jgi:flagellar protein FliO/FliZ
VIWITSGRSPQIKSAEPLSHSAHRLACVLLLIAGELILQKLRSRSLLNIIARNRVAQRLRRPLASLALIGGASRMLYAASATPFAVPVQPAVPSAAGGLLRVTVALLVVLAAVLAAAWLARRMRAIGGGGSSPSLELLAQLPLGTRERAVLVRVGDRRLLLGVAAGNIRTLHVLEPQASAANAASMPQAGEAGADPGAVRPSFKSLLLKSLGK